MDLENQTRIKGLADKIGKENLVVVLGAADKEGADTFARTVTTGDPAYAGSLAGVSLGLPVYHILELKEQLDAGVYAEHVEMMEMVLDKDEVCDAVRLVRDESSK